MDIKLPRLGEGAESGTVVSIFVKPGDQVKEGQTILELENEKAVAPIPASASGRVAKLYVKEGDKISAGQSILSLSDDGAATPAATRGFRARGRTIGCHASDGDCSSATASAYGGFKRSGPG